MIEYTLVEISVNQQFVTGLFQIPEVSDNHSLLTASDLNLDLMNSNLCFWYFFWLSEPNEENDLYFIIS